RSLGVLNQSFFNSLTKAENVKLLSQLIKRTPLKDSSKIVGLLKSVGIEIEPPADSYNPEPELPKPDMPLDILPLTGMPIGGGRFFTYRAAAGMGESVPVLAM